MTRPTDAPPVDGVPASIAAIMAAIRHEVARPAAKPEAAKAPVPAAAAEATEVTAAAEAPAVIDPIVPAADASPIQNEAAPAGNGAAIFASAAGDVAGGDAGAGGAAPPPLDADARALLAPLLKTWLDAHLPEIVETAVHAEIRRLTGMG